MLLLAIGWKAAIPIASHDDQKDSLVRFFERNHFAVVTEVVSEVLLIEATTASCRLLVARMSPDGSNRDLVRHLTAGQGRSFVVFGGAIYAQQPIFWTVLDYFRSRFLRELGFAERVAPVISVTADPSCNAEKLPWNELSGV
ncbi:hypothetical protein [Bosea thiooxidans]